MSSLVHDVDAVQKFIRVHAAAATALEHEQLVKAQSIQLQAKFRSSNIAVEQATEIMELLSAGPWSANDRQELCRALAAAATSSTRGLPQVLQSFYDADNYLVPSVWQLFDDERVSEKAKHLAYCEFLAKLGLSNPSEKTVQHCVVKFWVAVRGVAAQEMSGFDKLACCRDFKAQLKRCPKATSRTVCFPSMPSQWQQIEPELYEIVYKHEQPMLSKLNSVEVARAIHKWPMRSSSNEARGNHSLSTNSASSSSTPDMRQHMMNLMAMMQHMMGGSQRRTSRSFREASQKLVEPFGVRLRSSLMHSPSQLLIALHLWMTMGQKGVLIVRVLIVRVLIVWVMVIIVGVVHSVVKLIMEAMDAMMGEMRKNSWRFL